MIVAYTGLSGSGKTYHMTQVALSLMQRGEIVFSRHELEGAYPLVNEREMLRMNDCHVFFDEWHQDHSAKDWWNMDEVLKHMVTQSRKYRIIIHWSAQHWLYMDSFIRRNTDFCWEHKSMMRDPDTGNSRIGLSRAWKVAGIEMELKRRQPEILAKKWIWIKKSVYANYNSFKPIMLSKEKLTDEEINAIADPYSRERIHVTIQKSKSLSPNPAKDGDADFVGEQNALDGYGQAQDDEKLRHGQNDADDLDAGIKVPHPIKKLRRKRRRNGKKTNNKIGKRNDKRKEEASNHTSVSSAALAPVTSDQIQNPNQAQSPTAPSVRMRSKMLAGTI